MKARKAKCWKTKHEKRTKKQNMTMTTTTTDKKSNRQKIQTVEK